MKHDWCAFCILQDQAATKGLFPIFLVGSHADERKTGIGRDFAFFMAVH